MKKGNSARTNPVGRVGVFLLCLVLSIAAFWSGYVVLANWDDLWFGENFYESNAYYREIGDFSAAVRTVMELRQTKIWEGTLSYSNQQQLSDLEERLAPAVTNFRYQIHDEAGNPVADNLDGADLEEVTGGQDAHSFVLEQQNAAEDDYTYFDETLGREILVAQTADGPVECDPAENDGQYNRYGWRSDDRRGWVMHSSTYDTRIQRINLVMEYGALSPLTVNDQLKTDFASYHDLQGKLPWIGLLALLTLIAATFLIVRLCTWAGRKNGRDTLTLSIQDRIPFDLYLLLDGCIFAVLIAGGDAVTYAFSITPKPAAAPVVGLGVFSLLMGTMALGFILTVAVRLKAHSLLRNTVIVRCCAAAARFFGRIGHNWSITRRAVLLFLLYLVGTVLTSLTILLIPIYQGFVLWALCRWIRQWRALRIGTREIVGGNPEFKIDTAGMYRDLREHAEQLNDLGSAVGNAVDERLTSERFKAELITNVSHDLKTPLTSIISYVDLLKKIPLENPQAREYIEVLDRKSQRLKKLTEDLVDASKASTGNLTVTQERLSMRQLLCQALGEYEEKFASRALEVISTLPEDEFYVWADGRHLWRVIDNLFSNCYKYAMEHTRIYMDVRRWDGRIFLSIKNISQQALNVPPEQLMERFVRGEESRTTEGSGLGLSIARSLTELQSGTFRLDIDGDLFKATVAFPEAIALSECTQPEVPSEPA